MSCSYMNVATFALIAEDSLTTMPNKVPPDSKAPGVAALCAPVSNLIAIASKFILVTTFEICFQHCAAEVEL